MSSHLLSEMQQTADHLIVIGRGRLIEDASTSDVLARSGQHAVRVRASDPEVLGRALNQAGAEVEHVNDGALIVTGVSTETIGGVARDVNLTVHELTELYSSLEQVYLELTGDSLDYVASNADLKETR